MRNWLRSWQVLALLLAYLAARLELLGKLASPVFGWRPADMGGMALNFYRNGFHLFYPQVLWGVSGSGYVETELPLPSFLTAVLFRIFGVHEALNLVLPLLCGFGLVLVTYRFGCYVFDASIGLVAGLLVAVAPPLILLTDTGLWADPPMVLSATLGIYWLTLWDDSGRTRDLAVGVACISLAALLKLTALYAGLPFALICWRKYRFGSWRAPAVWGAGLAILLPSLAWYWHAHTLYLEYHNTFGILTGGYSKFGSASVLGDPKFYLRTLRRITLYHLTPLPSLGFVSGVVLAVRRRVTPVLAWLASIAIYVLVAAGGVDDGHYHYLLPFLPIGALTAGFGLVELMRQCELALRRYGRTLTTTALIAAALLFVANAVLAKRRFVTRDRAPENQVWLQKKLTGLRLKPLTKPESLIIVCDTQMDALPPERSMTPPDVFYFSDRRGWYLSLAWLSVDAIEALHAKGASDFVVSAQSSADFKRQRPDLFAYLSGKYRKLMDDDDGLAFALNEPS